VAVPLLDGVPDAAGGVRQVVGAAPRARPPPDLRQAARAGVGGEDAVPRQHQPRDPHVADERRARTASHSEVLIGPNRGVKAPFGRYSAY